jgi:hypothetical protein
MPPYTAQDLAQRLHLTPSVITRCLHAYEEAANITLPRDPLSGRFYQLDTPTFELMVKLIEECQQSNTSLISGVRFATRLITQKLVTVSYVALDPATQHPQARTLDDLTNSELRLALLDVTDRLWKLTEHLTRSLPRVTPAPAPVTPAPVQRSD